MNSPAILNATSNNLITNKYYYKYIRPPKPHGPYGQKRLGLPEEK